MSTVLSFWSRYELVFFHVLVPVLCKDLRVLHYFFLNTSHAGDTKKRTFFYCAVALKL